MQARDPHAHVFFVALMAAGKTAVGRA
ncbi:shikimate kinase, partial [Burkholderia pseudomallei]|nr:shikimate kinase [Burkholderia pseudomallei]